MLNVKQPQIRSIGASAFFLLLAWSFLIKIIYFSLQLLTPFSGTLQKQLQKRLIPKLDLKNIELKRNEYKNCIVFFCSSAGEYEQAKPLLDRLSKNKDLYLQIIFFSRSGEQFASARNETIPYFLSPADTVGNWEKVISALRPQGAVVIRHELWPAFIISFWKVGRVILVDGGLSSNDLDLKRFRSKLSRVLKSFLMKYIDDIYVINKEEKNSFEKVFEISPAKLFVVGDTKYDRVAERQALKKTEIKNIRENLDQWLGPEYRIIVGSAWPDDYKLVLDCYKNELNKIQQTQWKIFIALHEPTGSNLEKLSNYCKTLDLNWGLYSLLGEEAGKDLEVVFIDKVGILADFYGACEIAFIGGSLHHQIHNVLEPASHGLNLAFGPKYKNSEEAVSLVQNKLAKVTDKTKDLAEWWLGQDDSSLNDPKILAHINSCRGASDSIIESIGINIPEIFTKNSEARQ